uniref:MAM domain-containing protein n=1 Tax=Xiphophorus couchianus TaxID=32473 RepID=A0A3B5LIQ1_9TELE
MRSFSKLKWIRTNQENISRTDPWKGPGRDHSNNTASYFLYVTVPDGGLTMDWAAFQSPRLQPTNSSHPCKMVMYTHQFGPRSGGLTVLVADRLIYPVWERGGALGDLWVKAEVEIVSNYTFQILIMAAIRDLNYGGIAVDSIVLSPECRRSSLAFTNYLCLYWFDFSYPEGSSGWTDTSIGSQGWLLDKSSTTGEFLYVAEAAGQQLTEAQIRTPLLGPTGPVCNLSFDFALTGELSVRVIDSLLGVRPNLWEFSGKTGAGDEEETWQHVDVPVGVRKHRFQASCIFEDGLCAWYQDNSDNFDWSVVTGMDHSMSLVVDMWSPSLRGAFGRLLSFPQQPTATESCLTFYYKLYGPNALMFEAVRSGFDGQVAIDDVAFLVGPCTIPRKCSFEGQKCGYSSYGAINWLHRNGHTTTANGPKTDHTLGTELYYMMVNTDADVLPPGSAAVLISPVQQGTTKPECVSFWYHMTEGNPSLENGMCSWINIQDREREKLDWELTSPEKEKHYPVPPLDHTLGTHFLFFPSSNRTAANEKAWLVSPQLPPIKPNCLRFWAYKQIVFEGIKGTSGFVALDDIEYTVGFDCATRDTKP